MPCTYQRLSHVAIATVTLKSQRLRNEGGKDPNEEEEGCTHHKESYYTKAIGATKLHNLLSYHHRANGKMSICL